MKLTFENVIATLSIIVLATVAIVAILLTVQGVFGTPQRVCYTLLDSNNKPSLIVDGQAVEVCSIIRVL